MSGRLITFEGIGGSGKTTIAARAADWLRHRGVDVLETKEPGGLRAGTPAGLLLRATLLERALDPLAQVFGFELDRAITSLTLVHPALDAGRWVVSDRYHFGTIAYQGFGEGIDLGLIDTLSEGSLGGRYPDLSLVLDLPVDLARERQSGRTGLDRFDQQSDAVQERVRAGFQTAAKRAGPRAVIIDASRSLDDVLVDVQRQLNRFLEGRSGAST